MRRMVVNELEVVVVVVLVLVMEYNPTSESIFSHFSLYVSVNARESL